MQEEDILPISSMEFSAKQYGLNGTYLFCVLGTETKLKAWNGIGPKYFPLWARRLLSKLHTCILPAAYIHDLRFEMGGTKKNFKFANKEFLKNMKICLSMNKGRFTTVRMLVEKMRIRLAYRLVCWFGWKSWNKKEAKYNNGNPVGKVAVFGSTGMVGTDVVNVFKNRGWKVVEFGHTKGEDKIDIRDAKLIMDTLDRSFDAVVNCCAITDVNWCEKHPLDAMDVNGFGVKNIALACVHYKIPVFVHISTDYVFNQETNKLITPDRTDLINPVNVYGSSKRIGELGMMLCYDKAPKDEMIGIILRTSRVFGEARHNYVDYVVESLKGKNECVFKIPTDEYEIPTYSGYLANAIFEYVSKYSTLVMNGKLNESDNIIVDHITNYSRESDKYVYSKRGYTTEIVREAKRLGILNESCGFECAEPDSENTAPRPAYSMMISRRSTGNLGWREELFRYLKNKYCCYGK